MRKQYEPRIPAVATVNAPMMGTGNITAVARTQPWCKETVNVPRMGTGERKLYLN